MLVCLFACLLVPLFLYFFVSSFVRSSVFVSLVFFVSAVCSSWFVGSLFGGLCLAVLLHLQLDVQCLCVGVSAFLGFYAHTRSEA